MERHDEHKATRWGTYIGTAIGLLAFLLVGAVPGLLYGGYAGLVMANMISSGSEIFARIVTGGGMLIGLVAVGSLFLVVGALLGAIVGHGVELMTRTAAPARSKV